MYKNEADRDCLCPYDRRVLVDAVAAVVLLVLLAVVEGVVGDRDGRG